MPEQPDEPEELVLDPSLVAGVRREVDVDGLGEFFAHAARFAASRIPPELVIGPVIAVYHRDEGDRFDVTIGVPVADAPTADGIDVVRLPGGPALRVTHHGDYPTLRRAYAGLDAALAARGRARTLAWEQYLVGPGDGVPAGQWVTTVTVPFET